MKHLLAVVALAALTACASPQPQPSQPSAGLGIGHDLSCNASELRAPNGEVSTLYISLTIPDRGDVGEFCIATGCEAATFDLTLSRLSTYRGTMRTQDRTDYNSSLEISRDLSSFTLSEGNSSGSGVWTGTCNAAGS